MTFGAREDAAASFHNGGDMGQRMAAFDWSATALGEPAAWPTALKALVELLLASRQPMFLAWGQDRVWIYNDAFIPIAGRKHPQALGRPSAEVWAEAWHDLGPLFDRVYAGEAVHMSAFSVGLDRRGVVEEAQFDFSYTPVRAGDAVVHGLFGVCAEVTERLVAERRQVASAENERDRIFEMSRDLFAVATFDGYLKTINPAWGRLLGYSDVHLNAIRFADIIHPDDLQTTSQVVAALQRGESVHQFHVRLLKADGAAVPLAWSAVPAGPEATTFYTVGRDISDDARREAALLQSQKMEAVGQLTGGIAHDFNNLLQAVRGNLDLISRRPDDAERVSRWSRNGLAATERGEKLTAQLLAFSRSQRLELRPTNVSRLIAGMDDILQRSLGPRTRVTLDTDRPDLGVLADPTQLEMALLNLAINARDAMPQGGDLVISATDRVVVVDPDLPAGRYVEIRVSDTGLGMSPATAARAFDPFFTTKGVGQGAGLGLSQVYAMAKQAGGAARIEHRTPAGTVVLLLLKFIEATGGQVDVPEPARRAVRRAPKTVLVVDDDPDVRQFLAASLESLGFGVVTAKDGPRALALLDEAKPDLLLIDFAMPGMDGAQVANHVRAKHPDLPIIFASGYSDTAAIEAAVGKNAPLLRKPFGIGDLEHVVVLALSAGQ